MNEYDDADFLAKAFPCLFPLGEGSLSQTRKVNIKPAHYFAKLMAYHDGRFQGHAVFSFWALNFLQRKQVSGATLAASKNANLNEISAGMLRTLGNALHTTQASGAPRMTQQRETEIGKACTTVLGRLTPYFKAAKGTLPYMNLVRTKLFNMLKYPSALPMKIPTWFLTLSPAEQYWKEVGEALSPHLTPEEAAAVSFIERRRLVHAHPYKVTVMFQARVELLRKFIINGPAKPLGDVHDHFDKYEWQLRGGIHYHGIQWAYIGIDDPEEVLASKEGQARLAEDLDKYISTLLPTVEDGAESSDGESAEQTQTPSHPSSLPCTEALIGDLASRKDLKNLLEKVQIHDCRKHAETPTCRYGFPKELRTTTAVRFQRGARSNKFQVLTKREHPFLNNYNPTIARAWRGNTDLQYIGEPHGVAQYVAYYATKTEPFAKFLHEVARAATRLSPASTPGQVFRVLGNAAVGSRQVCHQEAVSILSRNIYTAMSRDVSIVSAAPAAQRNRFLLSQRQLDDIGNDSTDIFSRGPGTQSGKLNTYMHRPAELEELCMHDFEQDYKFTKKRNK